MRTPNTVRHTGKGHLSVIHRANEVKENKIPARPAAVIQTDLNFRVTGWNSVAESLHGQSEGMGRNLFKLIDITFLQADLAQMRDELVAKGSWSGEVLFKRFDGVQIYFHTTATYILNTENKPVAVMIVSHDISDARSKEQLLNVAEKKYETLLNTLPQGVLMMDGEAKITACNKRGFEILGLQEDDVIGMGVTDMNLNAIKPDGSPMLISEYPGIVSLQTGFPQRNVIMGFETPYGVQVWISVNSEALIRPGEFEPYAVVVSFTDITETIQTEKELKKSNDRFFHVSQITSDAIWDVDLESKVIYRSETFCRLSGYGPENIGANLDWWFNMVHPEDRKRVKRKLNEHIQQGLERWEDEYRFLCADGRYKYFFDSGIILYLQGRPIRILGAIRDLTEKKKLERQLMEEQFQRHKAINLASITAQEQEKSNISRELHDNVNQILMSAKLFMDTAKRTPKEANELLDKAIEYQVLALQEIRKISKSLSTSHINTVGLRDSVNDIVQNLKLLNLDVQFIYDNQLEEILSHDQRLMIFRVVQEQTSNIIKHAQAKSVKILINEMQGVIQLMISDDGVGFDPGERTEKGIGFFNITSRAEAYNGNVNIISSKGKGCTLELTFPTTSVG